MATKKPIKINHVLYYYEWLKIDQENKYNEYMKLSSRARDPQSSLHGDGLPRAKDPQARERLIIESSDALKAYYAAERRYWNYERFLEKNINQLTYSYSVALCLKYIWNLDRPHDQRINGIASRLGIRRKEVPAIVREAKEALADILRAQGMEIE